MIDQTWLTTKVTTEVEERLCYCHDYNTRSWIYCLWLLTSTSRDHKSWMNIPRMNIRSVFSTKWICHQVASGSSQEANHNKLTTYKLTILNQHNHHCPLSCKLITNGKVTALAESSPHYSVHTAAATFLPAFPCHWSIKNHFTKMKIK